MFNEAEKPLNLNENLFGLSKSLICFHYAL